MGMRHVATRRARKACRRMGSRGASRRAHVHHRADRWTRHGRAAEAEPAPCARPSHRRRARHYERFSGDKPGTSWAVFIGASGGCQRLFALVAPGEGTSSGRHPRHSEAADQCAPPCRLHLLSTMPNTRGNRTKRGGIQSIDRAARILNARASGGRHVSPLGQVPRRPAASPHVGRPSEEAVEAVASAQGRRRERPNAEGALDRSQHPVVIHWPGAAGVAANVGAGDDRRDPAAVRVDRGPVATPGRRAPGSRSR
jgi:hypothetical protein